MIIIGLNASDISPKKRKGNAITIATSGVTTNVSSPREIASSDCLLDRISGICWFGRFDSCIKENEELLLFVIRNSK
jgi:hypothetical protein